MADESQVLELAPIESPADGGRPGVDGCASADGRRAGADGYAIVLLLGLAVLVKVAVLIACPRVI